MKLTTQRFAKLVARLTASDCSAHVMAEATGLHHNTVQAAFKAMREEGVAHIGSWEPDGMGRDSTPVWRFGPGQDAPRRRMTQTERQRRHREKKRREADEQGKRLAQSWQRLASYKHPRPLEGPFNPP